MKIRGIEFDVEVEWDREEGRIEWMSVFLAGSDVELSEVLSDKVLQELEEKYLLENPYGDQCPEDYQEDR
jgi:hypothetical protein